jgi:hypothetical protein
MKNLEYIYIIFHLYEFNQVSNHSLSDHIMTKRKSLDELTDDITSMSNDFDGAGKRAAALQISKAKKASQCYETITFTDLAAWPDVVTYATVSDRLKHHIREYYVWGQVHEERTSHDLEQYSHQFDALSIEEHDVLAVKLCNIHAAIEYTARAQVIPEYLDHHVTGGDFSKHWTTILRDGSVCKARQRTMKRIENMPASMLVPGAEGLLIDYYDWSVDRSDKAVQHFLHRDFAKKAKQEMVDNYNEDDDDDYDDRTVTTSSYGVATSYLRAMHTAVIILRREVHPRSVLAPLTVHEWLVLTQAYGIPEHHLEGNKVVPRVTPGGDYSRVLKDKVTHEVDFLKVRSAVSFFRDLSITDAHFAARAMYLARQQLPKANLTVLHKEFERVVLSSSRAALDSFDASLTVVHSLLQRTHDIYEIDCAALAALQTVLEPEYLATSINDGHVMAAEVRRQLALYQQDRLVSARRRKRTTLAARGLDPGGLLEKAAGTVSVFRVHYYTTAIIYNTEITHSVHYVYLHLLQVVGYLKICV